MTALIWRILIAAFCVLIIYAVIPPFLRIIGFAPSADIMIIVRVCIAALAVLYVVKGQPFPPTQ